MADTLQAILPQYKAPTPTPNYTLPVGAKIGGFDTSGVFGNTKTQTPSFLTPQPTPSGGTTFNSSLANGYNTSVPPQTTPSQQNSGAAGLAQYTVNHTSTPNGGTLAMDANGSPAGYTSNAGYSINTDSIPSNALTSGATMNSLGQSYNSLQDYVNGVSQAQLGVGQASQYSPAYQAAQSGVYNAQATGAQLGVNQAAYANQAFGSNQANNGAGLNYGSLGGASTDFVNGTIGSEQSGNAIRQAQNTQQQTAAGINLNTQQLARTGNIAAAQSGVSAAQTQLQYAPGSVAQQNAQSQYNTLAQQYAGINPPPFDPNSDGISQLQNLHALIAKSPAYLAGFQSTYQTPTGGTGIYNQLNESGLQHNADGTISLVNDGDAITGAADRASAGTLTGQINSLVPAFTAANNDFGYITNFMSANNINQSNIPAINQVQQAIQAGVLNPGALAEFKAGIASLRTNYAALLGARNETPTQAGSDANALIPDNLNPAQLTQVQNALNVNGKNIINANQSQLQNILSKYGGQAGSTNLNNGSTGSGWGSLGD